MKTIQRNVIEEIRVKEYMLSKRKTKELVPERKEKVWYKAE